MDEIDPIFLEIDKIIRLSRLKEIEFIMGTDATERVRGMRAALGRLEPGAYLLGTGPSTVGIVSLNAEAVALGRPATVLEQPPKEPADYPAADTLYFVPREISRLHARVVRRAEGGEVRHVLVDLNSTCGTFVNGTRVDPDGLGVVLEHGDVISLGPSQTSTYVYYRARCSERDGGLGDASRMSHRWPQHARPVRIHPSIRGK